MAYQFDSEHASFSIGSFENSEDLDPRWFIDEDFSARQSVVLRYHRLLSSRVGLPRLLHSSISEGCRVTHLLRYRDVDINILDAVSLMATRTFKSLDACVISALASQSGMKKCALASGGNTGYARSLYADRLGIETYWFYPAENERLIPADIRERKNVHLCPVQDPGKVKEECNALIASDPEVQAIPTEWKVSSFEALGGFIAEEAAKQGSFDWIAQTVSAAFAPLAYYRVLRDLSDTGFLSQVPRFLGIQQEENCFMYKAWKSHEAQGPVKSTHDLLLPVIFDAEPHTYRTQEQFFELLRESRGDLETISKGEFAEFENQFIPDRHVLEVFRDLDIPVRLKDGKLVERAGFVAIAGIIKAIDAGTIEPGSSVLSILSGC